MKHHYILNIISDTEKQYRRCHSVFLRVTLEPQKAGNGTYPILCKTTFKYIAAKLLLAAAVAGRYIPYPYESVHIYTSILQSTALV